MCAQRRTNYGGGLRQMMRWIRWTALVASAAASAAIGQFESSAIGQVTFSAIGQVEPVLDPAARIRRLVHTFDFDERHVGNLDDVPLFWVQFEGRSFPRFVTGSFDFQVGHDDSPSLYVDAAGRNAAYRYAGPALRVVPTSDYYIGVWIRPNGAGGTRATLSAYYLDSHGLPISGTQQFGRLIGGQELDGQWHYVDLHVPAGPPEATHIGLTAWVVQSPIWNTDSLPHRHIEYVDVHGGAWFDDIRVYRLPSASLEVANPGNVFVAPDPPTLFVEVADYDSVGLTARLEVHSSHGDVPWSSSIPVQVGGHSRPQSIDLSELEPGHYTAVLRMEVDGRLAASQSQQFAVLPAPSQGNTTARAFGLVLDGPPESDSEAEVALLAASAVGSLKIPVWPADAQHSRASWTAASLDALLQDLIRRRVVVTGLFAGPPAELVAGVGPHARSLLDILLDDPEGWNKSLTRVVTPYSTVFRAWQLGADDDQTLIEDDRLAEALARVRQQMLLVMTRPRLAAPSSGVIDPMNTRLPAEEVTVSIPHQVQPAWLNDHLSAYRDLGYEDLSVYLSPSPMDEWDRLAGLGLWVRSIIEARHGGVGVVYSPQLWSSREGRSGRVTEPSEEFVVYRTIVDMLHSARPGHRWELADGLQVRTFTKGGSTVWAVWQDSAGIEPAVLEIQLGSATHQVDLWGRRRRLAKTEDGLHRLSVGSLPVFVEGVEGWLTALMSEMRILPSQVDFSVGRHDHRILLANRSASTLSGTLRIVVPNKWEIEPSIFAISVGPGQSIEYPVTIRYPTNESAGTKLLDVQFLIDQPETYYVHRLLPLQLELDKVDVWAYAVMEGDQLVLRHGLTNRSDRPISFRAFATVPGRSRQNRVIAKLQPGQSVSNEYRFPNGQSLRHRSVRLSLKEVEGPRIHNLDVVVP